MTVPPAAIAAADVEEPVRGDFRQLADECLDHAESLVLRGVQQREVPELAFRCRARIRTA